MKIKTLFLILSFVALAFGAQSATIVGNRFDTIGDNSPAMLNLISPTNLPVGIASSNYVGTLTGNAGGATNLPGQGIAVGNTPTNYPYNFTINGGALINLQKAFKAGTQPRLLYLGDSTGGDSLPYVYNAFAANYLYGTEPDIVLAATLGSGFFDFPNGNNAMQSETWDNNWWGTAFSLTNGLTQNFGGPFSVYSYGDTLSFWYIAGPNRMTATVETSPNNSTWTTRMTVDTSTGPAGLRLTNVTLTAGNYVCRITAGGSGSENRVLYIWPEIHTASTKAVRIFDGHSGGKTFDSWLLMGTNNIAALLTNFNPTMIFWQQTKQLASMTPTTLDKVAGLFSTYSTNSDIVLVQSQCDANPAVNSDPANGNIYQMQVLRPWAEQHHYIYLDDYSYLNDRSNIIANGLSAIPSVDPIHLNTAGQWYSGLLTVEQLQLPQLLASCGLFSVSNTPSLLVSGGLHIAPPSHIGTKDIYLDSPSDSAGGMWLGQPTNQIPNIFGDSSGNTYLAGSGGVWFGSTSLSHFFGGRLWPSGGWMLFDAFGAPDYGDPGVNMVWAENLKVFQTENVGTIIATNFTGNAAGLTNIPGGTLAGAVVALVSATNKVSTIYASMTNVVALTFMCLDTTNATVSISNIVEGVSFNIFASAYTTNKVAWSIRHPL